MMNISKVVERYDRFFLIVCILIVGDKDKYKRAKKKVYFGISKLTIVT